MTLMTYDSEPRPLSAVDGRVRHGATDETRPHDDEPHLATASPLRCAVDLTHIPGELPLGSSPRPLGRKLSDERRSASH